MEAETDFLHRLTAQSTIAELPSHATAMELATRGKVLAETLRADPRLPGVVVKDGGKVRGAISRGQYLELVGRHLGQEVFHPRPIRAMFDALEDMEEPMVLSGSTPIQEAVRRALGRPRTLLYEPVLVADAAGEARLLDFQTLLRADSRISELRNRQMSEILGTVEEGLLLVDPDHRIASEHSRFAEAIFGRRDFAGLRLPALVAGPLGDDRAELCRGYLETLFHPNVIEKLIVDINPLKQVEARMDDGSVKHLAFRFRRHVEDGAIRRVLVRIDDVTREVELAAEVEAREKAGRERVDLVFEIMGTDAVQLTQFLLALDREIRRGKELIAMNGEGPPVPERLATIYRSLHKLKGEAALLCLKIHQQRIHQAEDAVDALRGRGTLAGGDLAQILPRLAELQELSAATRETLEHLRRLGAPADAAPEPMPAPGIVDSLANLVADLSKRLGKPARFISRTPEEEIPETFRPLLRHVLVQLARNSVVHGLEPPDERQRLGKPTLATLQLAVRKHPESRQLEVVFQDDGAGLDYAKIARRARERGLPASPEDLPRLIFESGFSTAEEATLDAGRGVGLDVVRAEVERRRGRILPHSQTGKFCAFQILLPWESHEAPDRR